MGADYSLNVSVDENGKRTGRLVGDWQEPIFMDEFSIDLSELADDDFKENPTCEDEALLIHKVCLTVMKSAPKTYDLIVSKIPGRFHIDIGEEGYGMYDPKSWDVWVEKYAALHSNK